MGRRVSEWVRTLGHAVCRLNCSFDAALVLVPTSVYMHIYANTDIHSVVLDSLAPGLNALKRERSLKFVNSTKTDREMACYFGRKPRNSLGAIASDHLTRCTIDCARR